MSFYIINKRGEKFWEEVGDQLPEDIEKYLLTKNFDTFRDIFRQCENEGRLDILYNQFYVACYGKEISSSKKIEVRPLCKVGTLSKLFK